MDLSSPELPSSISAGLISFLLAISIVRLGCGCACKVVSISGGDAD